jgi:hypothetical protein
LLSFILTDAVLYLSWNAVVAQMLQFSPFQGKIQNIKDFRAVIGFVPQDDIMIRELTVRDNIEYSARGLRISSLNSFNILAWHCHLSLCILLIWLIYLRLVFLGHASFLFHFYFGLVTFHSSASAVVDQ